MKSATLFQLLYERNLHILEFSYVRIIHFNSLHAVHESLRSLQVFSVA